MTAAATASPTAAPQAAAGEIADIKAQMAALKARLDLVESQQEETARATFSNIEETKKTAAAVKAPAPNSVRIGTAGISARLYGLIEATTIGVTHTTAAGAPAIGMNTPWFSGSRWGLDVSQRLYTPVEGQPAPNNKLDFIAKLESEFELPSGNMDTAGVLFNRDAWVGIQSKAFGKLTVGRQNALPRDVAQIWGDAYGGSSNSLNEGGFTNTNNFKQLIFYASGGNSAKGQGDTRYDQAIVWKKLTDGGFFASLAYNFGDMNGPGGPNGSAPIPGAEFNKGSSVAGGLGFNGRYFHGSAFYTTNNVLEPKTIAATNIGHQAQSGGIGGNYDWTKLRLNAGMMWYTGDQGVNGRRYDQAWTLSTKIAPSKMFDYELGVQEFIAHNAAVNGSGYVLRPFRDGTVVTKPPINGTRFTLYGSLIAHPVPNLDLYFAADDLLTGGKYLDGAGNGFRHVNEYATGARFKF
ncbi:MAG: porin [Candidatus Eremiobacteraeota bacterium]|nr:porin [Candidatus Eremiobacteraeota bacterium]